MPSETDIILGLQMGMFHALDAINGSNDPAATISYQFEDTLPSDDISGLSGWRAWTGAEKAAVDAALALVETFLNVDFVEVTGNADPDLNFGMVSLPGSTAGFGGVSIGYSGTTLTTYDAFAAFDNTLDITANTNLILHELGHALGLDHSFEGVPLAAAFENNHYTVMSYSADPESGQYNDAMMVFDVLALQAIWGTAGYNTADTTYTGPRTDNVDTIWDTGGTDTFDAAARSNAVVLNLRDGAYSTFGAFEDVAIAFGVTIENAIGGTGDDKLLGNAAANDLSGNRGEDLLKGRNGRDMLDGGNGADVLRGGAGRDVLRGGGGADTLIGGRGIDKLWGEAGADTFCFKIGADKDVIRDFESGVDSLEIAGMGTRGEVLATAQEANDRVTFDFGGGDLLVVRDMTLDALVDDLTVI